MKYVYVIAVAAILVLGLFSVFTPKSAKAAMPVTTCQWPNTCGQ